MGVPQTEPRPQTLQVGRPWLDQEIDGASTRYRMKAIANIATSAEAGTLVAGA